MKQFANKKEFDGWIQAQQAQKTIEEMLYKNEKEEVKEMAEKLVSEGYDLDDLITDGHAYDFAGHTNNGWLYEDEADLAYIERTGKKVELRRR